MVPGMAVMFAAMMMARPQLPIVVDAHPVSDDDDISELIEVSVVAVVITVDPARNPMMIVVRSVIIVAATTARLRIRTGQHEASKDKDGSQPHSRIS